jgi:hypothetical protein
LRIGLITRQHCVSDDRLSRARKDGNAVPGLLPAPHGVVTGFLDYHGREFRVCRLHLLKAGHVGARVAQPRQEIFEPLVDVVDVEGGDFHGS